jgi:hypothetical protein
MAQAELHETAKELSGISIQFQSALSQVMMAIIENFSAHF